MAAIFGPRNHDIAAHINSMCNTLEIPHIEVRLEPLANEVQLFSMNLYPDTARLSSAFMDLLKHFKWEKFVVIYGDQNGKASGGHKRSLHLSIYHGPLDPPSPPTHPPSPSQKDLSIEKDVS